MQAQKRGASTAKADPGYRLLRVKTSTHQLIKVQAARKGKSMGEHVDELAVKEEGK